MPNMNGESLPRGSTPVPDPTVLTTQQLTTGLAALREIIETRLTGMDTATEINKRETDKIPDMISKAVGNLEKLHDEKFNGVEKQLNEKFDGVEKRFIERDSRTNEISDLNQKALDAALQASKEAAGKTELSFTKQISDLTSQFQTQNQALDDRVTDLKTRLDLGEGGTGQKKESRSQTNWVVGLLWIAGITAIGVIVNLIALLSR